MIEYTKMLSGLDDDERISTVLRGMYGQKAPNPDTIANEIGVIQDQLFNYKTQIPHKNREREW
jgi:hypothetical protein